MDGEEEQWQKKNLEEEDTPRGILMERGLGASIVSKSVGLSLALTRPNLGRSSSNLELYSV